MRLQEHDWHLTFEGTDDAAGFDLKAVSYGSGLQGMASLQCRR